MAETLQQSSTPVDPWEKYARTLADAFKPRPPVEYAIEGIFRLPSLNLLYGAPGDLKTLWLLDSFICAAAGLNFLPPLPGQTCTANFRTAQCPVMWIDYDMGEDDLNGYIEALARARNLDPATIPFKYYSMPSPGLDASNKKHIAALAERIRAFGARYVGIDNLGIIKGRADENTDQMIPVMNNLRWMVQETRAATTIIHHQRKANGYSGREGDKLRGHGSIEAALSLALLVTRKEGEESIQVKSTKARGAPVPSFGALFTYEHKPGTTDLLTARFFGVEDQEFYAIDQDIKVQLTGATLNKKALVNAVHAKLPKAGINRIRARVEWLEERGEIKSKAGARNEVLYSL